LTAEALIVTVLSGLTFGLIIFLIAVGLSLTLGTMGIVNLTHAVFFMVAGYVGLAVTKAFNNFWLGALFGVLVAGLLGLVLERGFLRYLHKLFNAQVLVTFGFVYIITNLCLWIWGAWPKMGAAPALLAGAINIGDLCFPIYRLVVILVGLVLAAGLWFFQEKTRVGSIIRAGMDDKEMTMGLGINYGRICTIVFCFGACLAGFAGVLALPVLGAFLEAGIDVLLLALCVVVVGGMGSIQGALIGSILIAFANVVSVIYFAGFAMFAMYLLMVIILLIRPWGLLGRRLT
jgi:branched-chain amino acid transport system permease protein